MRYNEDIGLDSEQKAVYDKARLFLMRAAPVVVFAGVGTLTEDWQNI